MGRRKQQRKNSKSVQSKPNHAAEVEIVAERNWHTNAKKAKTDMAENRTNGIEKNIEEYPDAYLREIACEFGCSVHAVEKALTRLKITRKKNDRIPREKLLTEGQYGSSA